MAKKAIVHCRICKGEIDRNIEVENVDWIMPSKNWFYHKGCYEDWGKQKNNVHSKAQDELWMDAAWDYLKRDLKVGVDFQKFKSQWSTFLKKGYTSKGIYFCLRYFYEVKKGDPKKSEGGIGIIPYIYQDGAAYWQEKEKKEKGICNRIEEQIKQSKNREQIEIKKNKPKKINKFDLADISRLEDE